MLFHQALSPKSLIKKAGEHGVLRLCPLQQLLSGDV